MVIAAIIGLIVIIAIVLIARGKSSSPSMDPEARHLGLYFLEFTFIPTFLGPYERGGHTDAMFLNIGNWEKLFKTTFKDEHKIEWNKLHVAKSSLNGKEYIVYTFPEPNKFRRLNTGWSFLTPPSRTHRIIQWNAPLVGIGFLVHMQVEERDSIWDRLVKTQQ